MEAFGKLLRENGHGKFVLPKKGFLMEDLGFCPKTNILIFKHFFKVVY